MKNQIKRAQGALLRQIAGNKVKFLHFWGIVKAIRSARVILANGKLRKNIPQRTEQQFKDFLSQVDKINNLPKADVIIKQFKNGITVLHDMGQFYLSKKGINFIENTNKKYGYLGIEYVLNYEHFTDIKCLSDFLFLIYYIDFLHRAGDKADKIYPPPCHGREGCDAYAEYLHWLKEEKKCFINLLHKSPLSLGYKKCLKTLPFIK